MGPHKNIHVFFENKRWKIREEGSDRVLAEMTIKEEALSFAEGLADKNNVNCIMMDNMDPSIEGVEHFDTYPDIEHIET